MKKDSLTGPFVSLVLIVGTIGVIGYMGDCVGEAYRTEYIKDAVEKAIVHNPEKLQQPTNPGYNP